MVYSDLEKYHADIFEYYTKIHSHGLTEGDSKTLDELLRASRNLMNAAKNFHDSQGDLLSLAKENDSVHLDALKSIQDRIRGVVNAGNKILAAEDESNRREAREAVEDLYLKIEDTDKKFIQSCSGAGGHLSVQKIRSPIC